MSRAAGGIRPLRSRRRNQSALVQSSLATSFTLMLVPLVAGGTVYKFKDTDKIDCRVQGVQPRMKTRIPRQPIYKQKRNNVYVSWKPNLA